MRSVETNRSLHLWVAVVATVGLCSGVALPRDLPKPHPDLPREFKQLMPRGGIPAVDEPQFVSADEAEIPDDAWVLGVEIDGRARAYSLNVLNRHEVVNDTIGEHNIAAIW